MKKLCLILSSALLMSYAASSQNWIISGNTTGSSDVLGTANSNPLKLVTGGVERLRINANGNFLLGQTNDVGAYRFQMKGRFLVDMSEPDQNNATFSYYTGKGGRAGLILESSNAETFRQSMLGYGSGGTRFMEGLFADYSTPATPDFSYRFAKNTSLQTTANVVYTIPYASSNFIIGGVADQGQKFQVNGNSYFTHTMNIASVLQPAGYKLIVGGGIIAEKVKVQLQQSWPDYVFNKGYHLMPLDELEAFLLKNKHLPGIPSADSVQAEGHDLGATNILLLQKIEELTLYMIELKKQHDVLKDEVKMLQQLIAK